MGGMGMIKDYIKYDPYNHEFNNEEFEEWLSEHCGEEQLFKYTVNYEKCYRYEQSPDNPMGAVMKTGKPPEHILKLDGYVVPYGTYLVVSGSGKVVVLPSWIIREYYWEDGD